MQSEVPTERTAANVELVEYAVGTIHTMYYDHTGGASFQPREFSKSFQTWLKEHRDEIDTRQAVVDQLKSRVEQLEDPFSKYLTRDELQEELQGGNKGYFLGLGAIVEAPRNNDVANRVSSSSSPQVFAQYKDSHSSSKKQSLLPASQVAQLPVVSAVAPDSPAERAGLIVGDRIVGVGQEDFLKSKCSMTALVEKYSYADNYIGYSDLTIAKPVYALAEDSGRDVVVAYRPTHVRIPTLWTEETSFGGGNRIVHYELLRNTPGSIFDLEQAPTSVGYIRLTRFSKASTAGFINAVEQLEKVGATSFIIDLRNNYGGVIQEAMLTASSLIKDPHAVVCYTLNSRGGFTPHDVEEFAVDRRYPGYLLSSDDKDATIRLIKRDDPTIFTNGGVNWVPPSSYASLREQRMKRGIHSATFGKPDTSLRNSGEQKLIILVNEGTASSAEVFTAALHDNGRTLATIGSKTYGKGLIQHTFPMPDGGGLRLTVAEYLTPALQHVTKVGNANFDRETGEWTGGGVLPDLSCESRQGIPRNIGADICVGIALDLLEETD